MRKHHLLFGFLAFFLAWSASSWAGTDFQGSVDVSQEYNDNVNETNHPQSDLVTVFSPGVNLNYTGNRVTGSVYYHGDFRVYDFGRRQNEVLNSLNAQGTLDVLADKVLRVDLADSNQMVFNNAALGQPTAADTTRNQVNQNNFSGGVTFAPNLVARTQTSLAYRVTGSLYGSSDDVNKYTQSLALDVLHSLTPKAEAGFNLQAVRQLSQGQGQGQGQLVLPQNRNSNQQSYLTRYIATVVGRYTYGDDRFLFCRVGAVDTAYDAGKNDLLPTWSAGLTHTMGKTALVLETQGDYVDNPSTTYNSFRATTTASLFHNFSRGTASIDAGYSQYYGKGTHQSQDLTLGAAVNYELTPRTGISLSVSTDNSSPSLNSLTRYYALAELNYQLPKNFSLRLYYRHKTSLSSSVQTGVSGGNITVNVVGLGLRKTF